MVKAQLFTKNIGLSCIGAKFNGFHAPANAKTYNQVTGMGPKGRFEITSFKKADGSLTKQVSRYLDDSGNETMTIRNFTEGRNNTEHESVKQILSVTAINRKPVECECDTFEFMGKSEVIMFKNKLVNTDSGTRDFHTIGFYQAGKPPREISFEPKWDGNAPKVSYRNIREKLQSEGLEYLPLFVSESALPRYQHVAKIQQKKYGLEGMVPDVKLVPVDELNPGCRTLDEAEEKFGASVRGAVDSVLPDGTVRLVNEVKESEEIIENLAHEYKHVDDISKFLRLKYNADSFNSLPPEAIQAIKNEFPDVYTFTTKSIEKGIISKKGAENFEYWHLKYLDRQMRPERYYSQTQSLDEHNVHPVEIGPIRIANEEVEKFDSLCRNIFDLLFSSR